jgi:aryl sulfotransferase
MPRQLYLGPLTDNRRWDRVTIRPDDIIVVTPPKCGTTWMQTIVALLLSGDPDVAPDVASNMPWVDIRVREMDDVAERLEAMTHRRCMKSHTPMDGLPLDAQAHYLCVFRHPLDAHFSFRHHIRNLPLPWFDLWFPEGDTTGITFRRFLDGGAEGFDTDAMPLALILRHFKTANALAHRPNVTLLHYADLQRDLRGNFGKLADLLGVSHSAALMERFVQVAGFDNMKQNAERYCPSGGKGFFKSDSAFFHSGTSGKWSGALTEAELAAYDAMMDAHLTAEERRWLEYGDGA